MLRRLLVVLVALTAPIASEALAQPGRGRRLAEQADDAEARSRFYTGAQLYQDGDYEAALLEFRESARLRPVPVVTFNIAQTLRAMHRYPEAIEELRRYLAESGEELPPDRRATVVRTIRALERRIATVTLSVEPRGAEIRVDGRVVGTAPLEGPLLLASGRRSLEVTAEGYVPVRDEVEVVGRQPRTLRIRLAPRETAGTIHLTSRPERASIRVDGLEVGEAPVSRRVPFGGHVVEAELPGYETYRTSVEIAERQELDLQVVLEEETDPGLFGRWWFWAGASAVVVGATVAIVLLAQPSDPEPIPGNSPFGSVIAVLRSE